MTWSHIFIRVIGEKERITNADFLNRETINDKQNKQKNMVTSIMDDGETLHQRRQWVSQYQLPKMNDTCHKLSEKQSRNSFRLTLSRDNVKKYITGPRSRFGVVATVLTIAFMALNLNQGPALNGYLNSTKIQNGVQNIKSGGGIRSLVRTRSANCKKTPFVTPQEAAHSMPATPAWYTEDQPSHIALCEELIRRNNIVSRRQAQDGDSSLSSPFTTYLVQESPEVCTDWSKPHSALMQLISSSIVAFVGERFGLEYRHNCHQDLNAEYRRNMPFDVTTVQEIFPELKMPIDQRVVKLGEVVHELCNNCIEDYKSNKVAYGSSEATHHCLAFPDHGAVKLDYVNEQVMGRNGMPEMVEKQELLDSQGFVVHTALEAVLPLVRNRLWHVARDWQKEAVIPRGDPSTGAVIYVDAGTSMPIPFNLYAKQIPPHVTRVEILSGPNCAAGNLAISMTQLQRLSCLEHGSQLRDYLHNYFKDERVEVGFKMLSSTAAAYTRMIQANTLLCPPETLTCLLPALAKDRVKNAVIFESPESTTYNWFTYLGTSIKNINVVKLTHEEMVVDKEQQYVQAKYAGFSVNEIVGQKPATSYQPLTQQNYNPFNSHTNHNQMTNTHTSSNTMTFSGRDKPDLNPSVDTFVKNGNTGSSTKKDDPGETSHLFEKGAKHGNQQNKFETDVSSYQAELGSSLGKKTSSEPKETDIEEKYELIESSFDNKEKEEEIGRTETSAGDMNSLFDRTGDDPDFRTSGVTNAEETDVDVDYQNLFENWR